MKYLAIFFLLLSSQIASAQSPIFQKLIGGGNEDYCSALVLTPEKGYLLCGRTESFGAGGSDVYCIKLDSAGNLLWTRTYGGLLSDAAYAITATADGNFMIAGSTQSFGSGGTDIYLVKINPSGDTIWTRALGGGGLDWANGVVQTPDSGVVLAARTRSFGFGSDDMYLLKISKDGELLWSRVIGDSGIEVADGIVPLSDGSFMVFGNINLAHNAGFFDIVLVRISAEGQIYWSKSIERNGNDFPYFLRQTSDGGYIITGAAYQNINYDPDIFLLKLDDTGAVSWSKTMRVSFMNGNEGSSAVYEVPGDGFVVSANIDFPTSTFDSYNSCLIWTQANGEITRVKAFSDRTAGLDMITCENGGYAICGITENYGTAGNYNVWFNKTDSLGNNGCPVKDTSFTVTAISVQSQPVSFSVTDGCDVRATQTLVGTSGIDSNWCAPNAIASHPNRSSCRTYPNPASDMISLERPELADEDVRLFNTQGKETACPWRRIAERLELDVRNLPAGLYYAVHTGWLNKVLQRQTVTILVAH